MPTKPLNAALARQEQIVSFLQDIIQIPSYSSKEGPVVARIADEMKKCGWDEVRIDGLGNVIGRIGKGKHVIAFDAHIDTVEVNDEKAWSIPPYGRVIKDGQIYGRGAVDQKAGMAGIVWAGKLLKELGLEDDFTLYGVGSVQEEDCDGMCWRYIINEEKIRPDVVVLTEPTNMRLLVGHRGRAEISVKTRGKAAHGSVPERGINAIYKMARIVQEIEKLHGRLPDDGKLGKGSVTVSWISCTTPSLCSVADNCAIHLDRRINTADTRESVIAEVQDAIKRAGEEAEVTIGEYDVASHKGTHYPTPRFFPAWMLDQKALPVVTGVDVYKQVFERTPEVSTWQFSTNGVAIAPAGIQTIGLGPGEEKYAHAVDERVPVKDVVECAAWYAAFPQAFAKARAKK